MAVFSVLRPFWPFLAQKADKGVFRPFLTLLGPLGPILDIMVLGREGPKGPRGLNPPKGSSRPCGLFFCANKFNTFFIKQQQLNFKKVDPSLSRTRFFAAVKI